MVVQPEIFLSREGKNTCGKNAFTCVEMLFNNQNLFLTQKYSLHPFQIIIKAYVEAYFVIELTQVKHLWSCQI